MSFLEQPGFADDVRSVLTDLLGLPPSFMDYTVQYNALNGLPIPISQITGFAQFTAQPAASILTSETTTSATYTDLATVGPELTGLPDGKYLLIYGATAKASSAGAVYYSPQINATAASDNDVADPDGTSYSTAVRAVTKSLSNNGSNTITMKYRSVGGPAITASYRNRWLIALRYGNL